MDLHLTSEQTLLRDSVAKFIGAAGPKVARGFREQDSSFAPARLRQAGEPGGLGVLVPGVAHGQGGKPHPMLGRVMAGEALVVPALQESAYGDDPLAPRTQAAGEDG